MRGLDCLDGTPLLDLKPDRTLFTPFAPPTPGNSDVARVKVRNFANIFFLICRDRSRAKVCGLRSVTRRAPTSAGIA